MGKQFNVTGKAYASLVLPSGNSLTGLHSSPYEIKIYDTSSDARKDFSYMDPFKIFDKLDAKMEEFDEAEEEGQTRQCIAINTQIQKMLTKINKVLDLGEK